MRKARQRLGSHQTIFSHPQDVHCFLFHVVLLLAYGVAFWLYLHPNVAQIDGPWSRLAFVLAAAFLLGWASGVDIGANFHNHAHRKIFKIAWLNRWFGRLWTVSGGWPSFFWQHAHVVVHHADTLGPTDWTLPKHGADGSFESIYRYCLFHWPWRYAIHLWRDFTSEHHAKHKGREARKEFLIFLVFWSIPLWIDPWMAMGLWILPQWIGNVVVMGPGMYWQHMGCIPKSRTHPFSHSVTYTHWLNNLAVFNLGYHIEHHDYPHVHWSELPALHARLKPTLPIGYFRGNMYARRMAMQSGWWPFMRRLLVGV